MPGEKGTAIKSNMANAKKSPARKTAKKRPKKMGRPTTRTAAIIRRIIEGLSAGTPLTVICKGENMPNPATVWKWGEGDEELKQDIARARDAGFDQIALDALRIADTPLEGTETEETEYCDDQEGKGERKIKRRDMLGHRKLQVETRLKLLAKWDPKRYGDRIHQELTGKDGDPIKTSQELSPELQEAILERSAAGAAIAAGVSPPASFCGNGEEK